MLFLDVRQRIARYFRKEIVDTFDDVCDCLEKTQLTDPLIYAKYLRWILLRFIAYWKEAYHGLYSRFLDFVTLHGRIQNLEWTPPPLPPFYVTKKANPSLLANNKGIPGSPTFTKIDDSNSKRKKEATRKVV